MSARKPTMICRHKLTVGRFNYGCQTGPPAHEPSSSKVVVGHAPGSGWSDLLLVVLSHGGYAQEHEDGAREESGLGGGDRAQALKGLDGGITPMRLGWAMVQIIMACSL
jgi:hypothetical protein